MLEKADGLKNQTKKKHNKNNSLGLIVSRLSSSPPVSPLTTSVKH